MNYFLRLYTVLFVCCSAVSLSACSEILPKEMRWGFVDKTGKWVIPPQFDGVDEFNCGDSVSRQSGVLNFSEGLCAVRVNNRWGYIDKNGIAVIPFIYENAGAFHEELACVRQNSKYGYIDRRGKVVIPIQLELPPCNVVSINIGGDGATKDTPQESIECLQFSCGRALFFTKGLWGYLDKSGKVAIPAQFGMARPFKDDLAGVSFRQYGICSLIDKNGKEVMLPEMKCLGFSDGMFRCIDNPIGPDRQYYFLDQRTGGKIGPYSEAGMFENGLAVVTPLGKGDTVKASGIIDKGGNFVLEPAFDFGSYDIREGRAIVMDSRKQSNFGVIDLTGRAITEQKYANLSDYYEGMALVRTERESIYIDKDGKEVLKFPTHLCNLFSEGLAAVAAPPVK